ncbi:hypothetical protein Tco_0369168 [Tanacetum coccineum]
MFSSRSIGMGCQGNALGGATPRSPEYVPEDHVPVYIPEPEHPEDLVPAEDEAPTPLLPPFFLSPRIRPLSPRALETNILATEPDIPEDDHTANGRDYNLLFPDLKRHQRTTRSSRVPPVTPAPNAPTTTTVTEAQLQALIDQGVAVAMAEVEASKGCSQKVEKNEKNTDCPKMILQRVKALKSKTMQEVIEFTTELMEDKTMPMPNVRQKVLVHPSAVTARGLAMRPRTVESGLPTTTTTTATTTTIIRRAMVAMSEELEAISKETDPRPENMTGGNQAGNDRL